VSSGPRNPAVATVLAILLFHGGGLARADGVDIATDVYIGAISNYYRSAGDSTGFDTFYVTAELNVYPSMKPYHAGLFIDYRNSSSDRLNDNVNLGGYFRFDLSRWDATTWLFVNRSPDEAGTWVYATRIRYRLTDSYKIGIEALAPLEQADKPKLMGGLYGSLSESLSFRALAGAGVRNGPDFAARLELLWQVH
jgi:hypothetical protein